MDQFQEALLGQIASDANVTVRDLKRKMRELTPPAQEPTYTAERAAAAQQVAAVLGLVDRAFSNCRLSDPLSYCECCTDPALVERLAATPRDDISEDDMAIVAGSLLYTLGGEDDMRYFVPRFCSDSLGAPLYYIDSVFSRFRHAGFDDWADAEKNAVREFLAAHWRFALLAEPRRGLSELTDPCFITLDCIASVGDIERALGAWDNATAETADARLLELLDRIDVGTDGITISGVGGYDDNAEAYAKLARWLRASQVRARIDASLAALKTADSAMATRVESVLAALSGLPNVP